MRKSILLLATIMALLGAPAGAQELKGGGFTSDDSGGAVGWYPKSVALVVGIDSYSQGWPRLSAAVSDARKMADSLRKRGFEVHEVFNQEATFQNIIAQLRSAAQSTGKEDSFLFFYSGHGYTKTSDWDGSTSGYLVPVEGKSGDIGSYISVAQLRDEILSNCKAKHVLMVVDSCFSGTLLTRAGIHEGAIRDYLSKRGIYGITAGMQDQPAVDGLFTNVLLEGLNGNADFNNDGYVTFKEMGMYAEQNVSARNRHQTPDYGVMYGAGQFVFKRLDYNPAPPAPPLSQVNAPEKGLGFLTVVTEPWVDIYLDDKPLGASPAFKIPVAPGRYKLRLVNDSAGVDKTLDLVVTAGKHIRIGPGLEPK